MQACPRKTFTLLPVLLSLFVLSPVAQAQTIRPIVGTDYYTIILPDGTRRIGQAVERSIDFINETELVDSLRRQVVRDRRFIQRLNQRLRGREVRLPTSGLFRPLRRLGNSAQQALNPQEMRLINQVKRKLRNRMRINQRAKDAIEAFMNDGVVPNIDTFTSSFLHRYQEAGREKWVFGVFVGFQLPDRYRGAASATVCASYYGNPEEPHSGYPLPFEGETVLNNDPCDGILFLNGYRCPGAYGEGIVGRLLASTAGSGTGPDSLQEENIFALAGGNQHFMRLKKRKEKCKLPEG